MIITWCLCIVTLGIVTIIVQYPTFICWYILKTQGYSEYLPIHTREYQAFCEAHHNRFQQALSILTSLKKEEKLSAKELERIEYNIALLSQTAPEKNQQTSTLNKIEGNKNIEWRIEEKREWSPYSAENNTITIESKVQYQSLDQNWIIQEQKKLLEQQLDRDSFLLVQEEME